MKNSQIKYSMLEDLLSQNEYNFYGIIYDASFPITEEEKNHQKFYEVTLKLIDPSLNCRTTPNDINSSIITLVIKSNIKECIPYIHKIGDVICVFNGQFNPAKKTVFLVLTNISKLKSSWTLFGGIENKNEYPLSSSKTNFDLKEYDLKALKEVKKWMKIYFQINDSLIYSDDVKLKNKKIREKNSSIVQILNKIEYNNEIIYLIQDETERCLFTAFKYFNFFEEGDVLRINNYYVKNSNKICMNKHSNMLKVPEFTDYYKMFKNNIQKNINYLNEVFDIPLLLSHQTNEICDFDEEFFIKLKDFNVKDNQKIKELKILKIVYPEVFYVDNNENYFNFSFECKDKNSENNIILTFCDFDGEGEGFLNVKKSEVNNNSNILKEKIEHVLNSGKYNKIKYEIIEIFDEFTQKNYEINRIIGKYYW